MEVSSISSVVQTIGGLLTREVTSLMGVKDQVEDLKRELIWMQSFLKEADAKKADNEVARTSVAEIRELAYDAEDVIETFALRVAPRRRGGISNVIKRCAFILNEGWLLYQTKGEIEKITARITNLTRRLQTFDVRKLRDEANSSSSYQMQQLRRPYPHVIDDNVVGLDDDIKKLVSVLVDRKSDCKVTSICGMGGLGKTTLAKKVYRHSQIVGHFYRVAWVYVSQQFQIRRVWEDILSSLTSSNERDSKQSNEEVAAKLFNYLKDHKCLVILDDIWSIEAWDCLKPAFPNASGSKYLLTSRNKEVVLHADRRGYQYELRCLNDDESWELFQKIAFVPAESTETPIDAKKEELGKQMVRRCGGLSLAIKVLGGILATKSSVHEWQMVFQNFKSQVKKGKGLCTEEVLALSYDDLPPYLRPCFLYLSAFPEDYEIDAERLIQLWVAEGFIVSSSEGEMVEDVAEAWLVELVERCMVQVGKRGPTLKIVTCRMHDLMRDLCLSMAMKENFLHIIDDPSLSSSTGVGVRRIAAHISTPFVCIRSSPLRSFLFFDNPFDTRALYSKELKFYKKLKGEPEDKCWTYLIKNFKLLRVFGFEHQGSRMFVALKLPNGIGNLIHLRFFKLSGFILNWEMIPSSLGNLRCLQSLDLRIEGVIHSPEPRVYVPNVIWKLEQLRHLYLPLEMSSETRLKLDTLRNLQTLINFNSKNCFVAHLSKLINLRKLEMYVEQEDFDENMPIITYKHLQSLTIHLGEDGVIDGPKQLGPLLSGCANLCELSFNGVMSKLPEYHHFSSNIASIYMHFNGM